MDAFLTGFTDELVKVGSKRDDEGDMRRAMRAAKRSTDRSSSKDSLFNRGQRASKNYLAATTLGAIAAPALSLVGRKAGRVFHNKAVMRAMKSATKTQKRKLKKQMKTGPVLGSGIPKAKPGKDPLITTPELGGQAVRGALYGSVLQMLKDHYSKQ